MKKRTILFMMTILFSAFASGSDIIVFQNDAQEKRYHQIIKELRCLVCQNQTVDESDAPLAADMRGVVADMIRKNNADEEIISFMTDRYGDFVLYRPPFRWDTLALWVLPFLLALWAIFFLPRIARQRHAVADEAALKRAESLLKEDTAKIDSQN